MRRRFKWDKKYLHWGVTAFCVIACSILFYMALRYIPDIGRAIGSLFRILSPFVIGLIITYLLNPVMRFLEKKLFTPFSKWILKNSRRKKTGEKLSRVLSVLFSELFFIAILAALVYLIIPQMYSSIETIVQNSNNYISTATGWVQKQLTDYPEVERYVMDRMGDMSDGLLKWLRSSVLPGLGGVVTNLAGSVVVFFKGLYNLLIGMVVSVYILGNIESFSAKMKRLLYCIFTVEASDRISDALSFIDETFTGYITATLLDAAIIGILCYIFCAIVNMPYALLVSVIVGVTNIIPFFGPFIGAIPSGIIILLVDPLKCQIFVIFVIILQQCDGNIIKPKVLGDSVGISGFWVLFSIIVGAGLFGFWGMVLGVPVFVVIYTFINGVISRKLKRSDLPTESDEYMNIERIDPVTRNIILKDGRVIDANKEETPAP